MDKQAVRDAVWDALEAEGVARFPYPPHGRIPNFDGAAAAAARLAETPEWQAAETLKCNPDAPQLPVRRTALRAGKTVYMAQPRLRDENPFLRLDPAAVTDIDEATTVSGVSKHGVPVGPDAVPYVDLIVAGSVAVTSEGARIGKGEGFSDLEWAVLAELGAVDEETTVATTVHERQVRDGDGKTPPPDAHDLPLDLIVTPERTIRTETSYERPSGVDWDVISEEKIAEIPVLEARKPTE